MTAGPQHTIATGSVGREGDLRLLRALLERAVDMVSVVDIRGRLQYHYPPGVLGYREGENFGQSVLEFVHPDDRDAACERLAEAFSATTTSPSEPFECRVRDSTGTWLWMEFVATNMLADPAVAGLVINGRDVTERRLQAERERRRTQWYQSVVQHASELVVVWDRGGHITYASPATIRFALGTDESGSLHVRELATLLVHPDDQSRIDTLVRRLWAKPGATIRFVARVLRHDGLYRSLDVTATNLLDDESVAGVVANAHDVTDALEASEALTRNEQRWSALVRHSYDIIAVLDELGTLQYASPAAEAMLGYTPESLVGVNAFDLVHPDDLEVAGSALAQIIVNPLEPVRIELRIRRVDGTWRHLEVAASNCLHDPTVAGLVLNNRDITDRYHADRKRRESEEWYRSLVQHSHDVVMVADNDTRVRYVSPSVRNVLGRPPDEFLGSVGMGFVHPDDAGIVRAQFASVVAGTGDRARVEARVRHADGSWRWVEATMTSQVSDPVVNGVILNLRDVSERKEAETQLSYQALHDVLTGLPNRALVTDRLAHAIARRGPAGGRVGVLFADLDRFKLINDSRGHEAGDQLLTAVARRIEQAVGDADTVARFGGDEFVIVVENVASREELLECAEHITETVAMPVRADGLEVYVTVSIGAALSHESSTAESLLRDADTAMYNAKEQGGGVVAFDTSIRRRIRDRFHLERELRRAVDAHQFSLAYQPIVRLENGAVIGFEALLRWQHPAHGVIEPGEFVPLAEETGLIIPIERQVRDLGLAQLARWRRRHPRRDLKLSLNVSATQLRDSSGFSERVATSLERAGLEPSVLTLELTESFLIENTDAYLESIRNLKAMGVRLAVDDFGTRYSSLAYLHRMPLDGLKIDRSFVQQLGPGKPNNAIVKAVITMAETLGLSVVAEGVETAEQASILVELGCRLAQGFRYSAPLWPADVEALFREQRNGVATTA